MPKAAILVVEDEQATADLVKSVLESESYAVSLAKSVFQAQSLLKKDRPDLVILDRNLPDKDGLDLCRELRAAPETQALPVLFLTGKKSLTERVTGLRMGADDYLAKPFAPEELLARVEALLRRGAAPQEAGRLAYGPLQVNVNNRTASLDGKPIELTGKEFDLLRALVERRDRVLTRQFLLSRVWGYDAELELSTKAVDMVVVGLRKKLGRRADLVETVKGYGYRLKPEAGA